MQDTLTDRIYEAAFVPENWPDVLGSLAERSGAAAGEFLTFARHGAPIFKATPTSQEALGEWIASGLWMQCEKPQAYLGSQHAGFIYDRDLLTREQYERDPANPFLARFGLGGQVATTVKLPTGDVAVFSFERWLADGPPGSDAIEALDIYRPDIARAALVSARLGLERAEATVNALGMVDLGAAVIDAGFRVLSSNSKFDQMTEVFGSPAFGKISLRSPAQNQLFQQAIAGVLKGMTIVQSIVLPATETSAPMVINVLPVRRNARDLFASAEALVAVTSLNPSRLVPSPTVLSALFDLTPAEARVAASIAEGHTLKQIGVESGITYSTVRTYLDRVFDKTGCRRQPELAALLRGVFPEV